MEVVTRDADAQDVEPARRLAVKTAMFSEQESHSVAEQLDAVIAGEALGTVLVATVDETVAGVAYVAAGPFSDRCFNLHFLAVEPERHGRGIGSRLVAEVEQRLVSLGPGLARVLLIETSSTPQYEATRAFYSARGYTHEATVRDFYGPSDHKIVFWKLGCQHFSGQVALLGP